MLLADTEFVLRPNVVVFIMAIAIPVIAQLVAKNNNTRVKIAASAILAMIVEFFAAHRGGHGEVRFSGQELYSWAITLAIAVLSYIHFWQPVAKIDDPNSAMGKLLLPEYGIGPSLPPDPMAPPDPAKRKDSDPMEDEKPNAE